MQTRISNTCDCVLTAIEKRMNTRLYAGVKTFQLWEESLQSLLAVEELLKIWTKRHLEFIRWIRGWWKTLLHWEKIEDIWWLTEKTSFFGRSQTWWWITGISWIKVNCLTELLIYTQTNLYIHLDCVWLSSDCVHSPFSSFTVSTHHCAHQLFAICVTQVVHGWILKLFFFHWKQQQRESRTVKLKQWSGRIWDTP